MEVFLIFPKSQQAKQELAKELAKFQSEQVLKCPEAALFHGAEAGTGGRSVKAPEGAEMIHTQTCRPAWDAGLHVLHMLIAEFDPTRVT